MNLRPSEKKLSIPSKNPSALALKMKPPLYVSKCLNSPVLLELGVTQIVSLIRGMVPALSSHNGHNDIHHSYNI